MKKILPFRGIIVCLAILFTLVPKHVNAEPDQVPDTDKPIPRSEQCPPGYYPTPDDIIEEFKEPECSPVVNIWPEIKADMETENKNPGIYVDPYGNEFDIPIPGGVGAGVTFKNGACQASDYANMHGNFWVRPHGVGNLNVNSKDNWLLLTTTNHTRCDVEVAALYHENDGTGNIGIYDWSLSNCNSSGWTVNMDMNTQASCYIRQSTDEGSHQGWYILFDNVTDKPTSQFRNYVLFYNRCLFRWDKVYEHYYSTSSITCSGTECQWWGPILETFDLNPTPQIWEIGISTMNLDTRYNGNFTCSGFLTGTNTNWTVPQSPWNTYHRTPNSFWGVGNFLGLN